MLGYSQVKEYVDKFPFASLIIPNLACVHIPLHVAQKSAETMCLYGHISRNNPFREQIDRQQILAIFHGPQSYISPYWYSKGPAVPTWYYGILQITGTARLLDRVHTAQAVKASIQQFEPQLLCDKQRMPDDYFEKLGKFIIGVRIEVKDIKLNNKLGHHKQPELQANVLAHLSQSQDPDATKMAQYLQSLQLQ